MTTSSSYLDMLDVLLRPGIAGLSEQFVATQVDFVASRQQLDGGFVGRRGSSDPYYTDFALRTLAWLAPEHAAFDRAGGYVAGLACPPRDVVECFNFLSASRLMQRRSARAGEIAAGRCEPAMLVEWLSERILPGGGFARFAEDDRVSAYHTFLGSLCFQMLSVDMPAIGKAIQAVGSLSRSDGGFAELADQQASQTNATAAAVGFLLMHDALPAEKTTTGTARFLVEMQSDGGGLRAHAGVAGGDLLSTFTGLLTLAGLGRFQDIDVAGVARFLRRTARADGRRATRHLAADQAIGRAAQV